MQRLSLENPRYGYRRITARVRREGWPANLKRIARIRRQDNLLALRRPAFRPATTDGVHGYTRCWPNLVRSMVLTGVNQLWAADITHVRLGEAFVYLAVVLDVFSRKVVGWAITDHLRAELAIEALKKAWLNAMSRAQGSSPTPIKVCNTPAEITSSACSPQASGPP